MALDFFKNKIVKNFLNGREKLANRKKNKLDIYAETRIFNLKLKNKNISTRDLINEIIYVWSVTRSSEQQGNR